jgi:hypothetical protein
MSSPEVGGRSTHQREGGGFPVAAVVTIQQDMKTKKKQRPPFHCVAFCGKCLPAYLFEPFPV